MAFGSKRKGSRIEREIVDLHLLLGVPARRVPLSGATEGWKGDVRVVHAGSELMGEVKARGGGAGFKTLERWLGGMDMLFLRRDRAEPLVLLPWRTYERLLKGEVQDVDGRSA